MLSAPSTNRITFSFRQDVALDEGITLYPGDPPFKLYRKDIGSAICLPIYAVSAVGAQNVEVTSFLKSP